MKNQINLKSAIVSGIAATAAMTLFMLMAPLMGIKMNIPAMLATTMGLPIVFGWIAHFMVGIILALIYSLIYLRITKRKGSLKSGAAFSLFPWLMAQIIIMPMMNVMNGMSFMTGMFSGSILLAMASLAGHLIYGIVLGKLYNPGEEKRYAENLSVR